MSWGKDPPVGASWRPPLSRPAVARGGGAVGAGQSGEISTLHVSGFPQDCTDREMENFCQFLPGFVAAKATLKGQPKVWVRFETAAGAQAAMPFIDGQPFDWREPSVLLWASVAKTDLNPDWNARPKGPLCIAGAVDELLGISIPSEQPQPHPQANRGMLVLPRKDLSNGGGVKRPAAGGSALVADWPKRPRAEQAQDGEEIDTIVVIRPSEQGLNAEGVHDYFLLVEGYVALRMGGANCFVKFASAEAAQTAVAAAESSGLTAQIARTNMNVMQATHFADTSGIAEPALADEAAEAEP